VPIEEVISEIDAVSAEQFRSIARHLIDESSMNVTALGKFD
jgi:hypothetical protein